MTNGELIILEDDADRVGRFRNVASELGFNVNTVRVWANAILMAEQIEEWLDHACLISLDHDLFLPDGTSDAWGDGMIIARMLATRKPAAPVIVHTSNRDAGRSMMETLAETGWNVERVPPIGERWIEEDWRREVTRLAERENG